MKSVVVAAILAYSMILRVVPIIPVLPDTSMPAQVYYNSNLTYGTTSTIDYYLELMGYDSRRNADPSEASLLAAFGQNGVLHMLGHGSAGSLQIYTGGQIAGSLTANEVYAEYSNELLPNLKFVFLEGCSTAVWSNANGAYPDILEDLGVDASVTFEDSIWASSATDGIHNFAKQVYYNLYNGASVQSAVFQARAALYAEEGWYAGAEFVEMRGEPTTLN